MSKSNSPIALAVEPLRAAAIENAAKNAAAFAERTLSAFEADRSIIEWKRDETRFERASRNHCAGVIRALCVVKGGGFVRDAARIERFIADAKEAASVRYTAFIAKLEHKVGAHTAARLEGNHVWGESFLYITKADGAQECWKTQQITNVSVLGRPFPQWPSRKVKAPKR